MKKIKVLVVEDSAFFRSRIVSTLQQDGSFSVETAVNGREGVNKIIESRPDVVTMDIDMPELDGISAVREVMRKAPVPIMMFSALTHDGAQATLDALAAGAADFFPKQLNELGCDRDQAEKMLCERLKELASSADPSRQAVAGSSSGIPEHSEHQLPPKLIVIGTSTGGPVALQRVLATLPADFPIPLVLVQHMPSRFTGPFAERLDQQCRIQVREAIDGDVITPGVALLAPGGLQTGIRAEAGQLCISVVESEPAISYRPSVDFTFRSASTACPGRVLGIVMTGMGNDGCDGARHLKQGGSTIWAQDRDSSVVYGMPMAVSQAGLADRVMSLDEIGPVLAGVA